MKITADQVHDALEDWGNFWDLPKVITSKPTPDARAKAAALWVKNFADAINTNRITVRYWDQATTAVKGTCRWFPMPVDVHKAAADIREERASAPAESDIPKRHEVDPKVAAEIHRLTMQFMADCRQRAGAEGEA